VKLLIILALIGLGMTLPADAQISHQVAVTAERWEEARTLRLRLEDEPMALVRAAKSSKARHVWLWVAGGAVVGAATGLIWAGTQIAKSDDPMMIEPALALVGGIGAVAGGALGAIAWVIAHPAPDE